MQPLKECHIHEISMGAISNIQCTCFPVFSSPKITDALLSNAMYRMKMPLQVQPSESHSHQICNFILNYSSLVPASHVATF